jgi:signal transduction histidine kinase
VSEEFQKRKGLEQKGPWPQEAAASRDPSQPEGLEAPYERLQSRYERLELLYRVSHVLHSTLDPDEALKLIVRETVGVMKASSGSVVLLNPTNGFLEIQASHGLPPKAAELKLRPGEGITGWVARTGTPARVGDVASDHRYVLLRQEVRSEMAVPLEVNGEVRGVLNVDSDRLEAFSSEDELLLQALAAEAAKVIENTWLYEQLRLKVGLFESLASVSHAINSTINLEDALMVITREACALMRAKLSSLMLLDESGQWLDLGAAFGAGEAYLRKPRLSVAESLLGVVVRRRKPMQVENVQTSSQYQHVEVARKEGLIGLLSVPLLFSGRAIGTLNVYTGGAYNFSNQEIRILSALAELSGIAIEKARLYERVVDVEEQLRQSEKFSALGLLAAEVAHEIRNPLTVMKMLYHSLDLKFSPDDPRSKDARIISEKIEHLNRIVEQILDLGRTAEPRLAPLNLNKLIEELLLLVRHKLQAHKIELTRRLDSNLPPVAGDAPQLEQAFLNIILNAAEAMPNGGTLTISTGTETGVSSGNTTGRVTVEFKDSGPGMTQVQQQSAYDPVLTTTKPKGTGLGLAIVRRILEAHNAEFHIKSHRGRGTAVKISLPAA